MRRRITLLALLLVSLCAPRALAWTDRPLTTSTKVRLIHIQELRTAIDAKRVAAGLAAYPWTDNPLTAGSTQIRDDHILELRLAISQVYVARGWAAPSFTDPGLSAGTPIRTVHIEELRDRTDNAPTGPVLACSCTAFADTSCGAGSCAGDEMQSLRTCSPVGCNTVLEQCQVDASCGGGGGGDPACSCTSWTVVGGCGSGGCGQYDKPETRTCTPSGCSNESRCNYHSSCEPPCDCTGWADSGCGGGSCVDTKRRETRTCTPSGCDQEEACQSDYICEQGGGGGGGGTCDDLPVWARKISDGTCAQFQSACEIPGGWNEDPTCP